MITDQKCLNVWYVYRIGAIDQIRIRMWNEKKIEWRRKHKNVQEWNLVRIHWCIFNRIVFARTYTFSSLFQNGIMQWSVKLHYINLLNEKKNGQWNRNLKRKKWENYRMQNWRIVKNASASDSLCPFACNSTAQILSFHFIDACIVINMHIAYTHSISWSWFDAGARSVIISSIRRIYRMCVQKWKVSSKQTSNKCRGKKNRDDRVEREMEFKT